MNFGSAYKTNVERGELYASSLISCILINIWLCKIVDAKRWPQDLYILHAWKNFFGLWTLKKVRKLKCKLLNWYFIFRTSDESMKRVVSLSQIITTCGSLKFHCRSSRRRLTSFFPLIRLRATAAEHFKNGSIISKITQFLWEKWFCLLFTVIIHLIFSKMTHFHSQTSLIVNYSYLWTPSWITDWLINKI